MKKNRIALITSILAVACLASCGGNAHSSSAPIDSSDFTSSSDFSGSSSSSALPEPEPIVLPEPDETKEFDNSKTYLPKEILLNHRVASILVDEQFQLSPIAQYKYDGSNLQYESSNDAIVTVSEDGLLKGIKAGNAQITVSDKDHPELSTVVPVTVNAESNADQIAAMAEAFNAIDEEGLNQLVDYELYEKSVYREGELIRYDRYDQRMVGSKPDGYFRIWETDCEIKTQGGSMDFTNFEWIFHTNRFFDTYIYHTTGDVNNYLRVPTQSFMDEGERIDPVNEILDNLFTSGKEILENMFENAKLSRFTDTVTGDYSNVKNVKVGSNGAGQCVAAFDVIFENETADNDDESRYGIPVGTPMPAVQGMRYVVENNKVISYSVHLTDEYEIDGVKYNEVYDIDHIYHEFGEDSVYDPDKSAYTQVYDIFDL